jgi:hypothetical protein
MKYPRTSGLLACVLLACGCGSEPDDRIFGTYALVGVEGQPLPYLSFSDAECDEFISEGELTLAETGTYNLELLGTYDCSRGGGQNGTQGRLYTGIFSQDAGDLEFQAQVQGGPTVEFSGTATQTEARVTVPVLPPQTGPDLELHFAVRQSNPV